MEKTEGNKSSARGGDLVLPPYRFPIYLIAIVLLLVSRKEK